VRTATTRQSDRQEANEEAVCTKAAQDTRRHCTDD
jgi:hypothetical protein